MEPIVAHRSVRSHAWAVIFGAIAAAAVYAFGLSGGQSLLVGAAIAAGPAAVGLARAMSDPQEVLRIDDVGITDHRAPVSPIPWNQVERTEMSGSRLHVWLRDPVALGLNATLWTRANQPLGAPDGSYRVTVNLGDLDVRPADVHEAVWRRLYGEDGGDARR